MSCSLIRGGGGVLAGTEERIPGLSAQMAVKAAGGAAADFMTSRAAAMVGPFKTEKISMVALAILTGRFEMLGREGVGGMTITAGNTLAGDATIVTAHAVRILRCGTSGVMMAFATISDHVDMAGMIKLYRLEIFAELVNSHLCRRRYRSHKWRQTGNASEGGDDDRNDYFDLHDGKLSLSTRKRSTGRRNGEPVSNNRRQRYSCLSL